MSVIAGDIGGTKTLLALAEGEGADFRILAERRYDSAAYDGLEAMVRAFLAAVNDRAPRPDRACFAVAGPVSGGTARQTSRITNLPWALDSEDLAAALNLKKVRLINDFVGVGYGIEALGPDDLTELQPGRPAPDAPRAVLGAGTGLGHALLIPADGHYETYSSEGGHTDFAPADPLQTELLTSLRPQFPRVSTERVLSGPGLVLIHAFLRERRGGEESAALRAAMEHGDPAAAIATFALEDKDPVAREALDLFVAIYGARAGDLALMTLSRGGLYLAGGIAPKIVERLRDGPFLAAFRTKGRMSDLMEEIPVRVVLNPQVGLWGAVLAGLRL